MILIIFTISVVISLLMLFAIRKGKIIRHPRFLKYVNVIHLIAASQYLLFFPLAEVLMWGRGEAILFFFIYSLFGVTALISNIVVLVIQYVSRNK